MVMDVKKAYDNVSIPILVMMVEQLNAEGNLSDEALYNLNCAIDDWSNLDSDLENGTITKRTKGIPQGSALAPLIFALYNAVAMRDVSKPQEVQHLIYADNNIITGPVEELKVYVKEVCEEHEKSGLVYDQKEMMSPGQFAKVKILGHYLEWKEGIVGWNMMGLQSSLQRALTEPTVISPPDIGVALFNQLIISKVRYALAPVIQHGISQDMIDEFWTDLQNIYKRYALTVKFEGRYFRDRGINLFGYYDRHLLTKPPFILKYTKILFNGHNPRYKKFTSFSYAYWNRSLASANEKVLKGWFQATKFMNTKRLTVRQWYKVINGNYEDLDLEKPKHKLVEDLAMYDHNNHSHKAFIHNLKLMDAYYLELVSGNKGSVDLVNDDHYVRIIDFSMDQRLIKEQRLKALAKLSQDNKRKMENVNEDILKILEGILDE